MIQMIKPRTTLDGSFSVYGFHKTFVPVYLLFSFCSSLFGDTEFQRICLHNLSCYWHKAFAETGCLLHHRSLGGAAFPRPPSPNSARAPGPSNHVRCLPRNGNFNKMPALLPTQIFDRQIHHADPSASLFSVELCNSPHREAHLTSDLFSQIWRLSSHLQQVQSDLDLEKLLCQEANDNSVSIY